MLKIGNKAVSCLLIALVFSMPISMNMGESNTKKFFPKNILNDEKWVKTFGGKGTDFCLSVEETMDGGYILAGYTYSFSAGESDLWLIKTDANGNEEWNKTFGGVSYDAAASVQQTADGGYIVIGYTWSYGSGESDIWLIKTDEYGSMQWNKTFGGEESDDGYAVKQTPDGGYITTGWIADDICLVKTYPNGDMEWNKTFSEVLCEHGLGGAAYALDLVDDDNDGVADDGYIITGSGYPPNGAGRSDVLLIKTDEHGNLEWNKSFGRENHDEGWSVQQTADGGYIIVGNTGFSWVENLSSNIWLIKTDGHGNMEWDKTFGGEKWDEGYGVQQTDDGGYIITGYTRSFCRILHDIWLIKTDKQGNMEWDRKFGGLNMEIGFSVRQTSDSGYIIVGGTYSYGAGGLDAWLVKTDSKGRSTHILQWIQFVENCLYILGREILPQQKAFSIKIFLNQDVISVWNGIIRNRRI